MRARSRAAASRRARPPEVAERVEADHRDAVRRQRRRHVLVEPGPAAVAAEQDGEQVMRRGRGAGGGRHRRRRQVAERWTRGGRWLGRCGQPGIGGPELRQPVALDREAMADVRQPDEAGMAGTGDELPGLAGVADLVDIALEGDPGRRIAPRRGEHDARDGRLRLCRPLRMRECVFQGADAARRPGERQVWAETQAQGAAERALRRLHGGGVGERRAR